MIPEIGTKSSQNRITFTSRILLEKSDGTGGLISLLVTVGFGSTSRAVKTSTIKTIGQPLDILTEFDYTMRRTRTETIEEATA